MTSDTIRPDDGALSFTGRPFVGAAGLPPVPGTIPGPGVSVQAAAAAAGVSVGRGARDLARLAAAGRAIAIEEAGSHRLPGTVPDGSEPADVRRAAHGYLRTLDAALARAGVGMRYWELPESDREMSPEDFGDPRAARAWLEGNEARLAALAAAAHAAGHHDLAWQIGVLLLDYRAYLLGGDEQSEQIAADALAAAEAAGSPLGQALALSALAACHLQHGAPGRAAALTDRIEALFRDAGDDHGLARTRNLLGILAAVGGDAETALGHYLQAAQIAHGIGDGQLAAMAEQNQADLMRSRGSHTDAELLLARASEYFQAAGMVTFEAANLQIRADLARQQGDPGHLDAARAALERSAALGAANLTAWALRTYAASLAQEGNPGEAAEAARAAAVLHLSAYTPAPCIDALEFAAGYAADAGDKGQAVSLRADAARLRDALAPLTHP